MIAADTSTTTLRLGTRGSLLARMQSQAIANALESQHPSLSVQLVICKTTGDRVQDRPLHDIGGKGLFTKELENALLSNEIDFAVHSFKDVPVTMPLVDQSDLVIAAVPRRADPRDVLVSRVARSIQRLPVGSTVGTGSLRRRCQILAARPDLRVEMLRGNIDTRTRRARDRDYDAVCLALAGLKRSGLFDESDMTPLSIAEMLPAAAQGALAIQCRRGDEETQAVLSVLDDPTTRRCVNLERALVQALNGDCHSPIAAYATVDAGQIRLRVAIGARGGELPLIRADATAPLPEPAKALDAVLQTLEHQHVRELLDGTIFGTDYGY
jgi:hydroxymethylbilane synthase